MCLFIYLGERKYTSKASTVPDENFNNIPLAPNMLNPSDAIQQSFNFSQTATNNSSAFSPFQEGNGTSANASFDAGFGDFNSFQQNGIDTVLWQDASKEQKMPVTE